MADVSLNGLKVKTDSLPNDWYVSLINPKDGEPAEIMTVAKLVELFTGKQPEATDTSNGLMSVDAYKSLLKYKGVWTKDNVDSLTTNGTWINTGGNNISETMVWGILCVFNAGSYIAQMSVRGSEVRVRFSANNGNTWNDPIILNNSVAYTATANSLTEVISASPVLESRQVRGDLSANTSISNLSSDLSGQEESDGSTPVKTEPSGEQYVWSIDKIGKAVLELQEENKRLKQILNISDDSEVQQM